MSAENSHNMNPNLISNHHDSNNYQPHHTVFQEKKNTINNHNRLKKSQTSSFLKNQIGNIINNELKAYRIQKKLQKQLQDYKKNKQRREMIQNMHKIQKFRHQESQTLKNKLQKYMKESEEKSSKIFTINQRKKSLINKKKSQNDKKIKQVLQRHYQTENQDINNRLSRISSVTSKQYNQRSKSRVSSTSRDSSSAQYYRGFITAKIQSQEKARITNYLTKMRLAENRILDKEIKNQERKQKSLKTMVKNLTNQRNMKNQQYIKSIESQYNSRMQSFYQNASKFQLQNSTLMMTKSMIRSNLRQKAIKNKQFHQTQMAKRVIDNFNKKNQNKQNIREIYRKKLDFLRTKSSFMNRTIQLKKQSAEKQNEKNMRVLYEKLNKIKRMKPTQIVSQKEKQQILSLLDSEDPQYNEIVEFLSYSRAEFMRKKIEKEEEKAKAQKIKKTARFTNKV